MLSTESRSLNNYFCSFQGKYYDSVIPQTAFFPNSKSCQGFEEFISATIIDRVRNGSFLVWRKVNDVQPPYLVMPITVEPSEPRMCHDERFLNLWIRDLPFLLDYITSLPRYVFKSHTKLLSTTRVVMTTFFIPRGFYLCGIPMERVILLL